MADNTVVTGWLKNSQDNLFAPKTLISQVVDVDGSLLENKITEKMDALKAESKEYTDGKLEELIGEKSIQEQIDDHNDSNQSHDDIRASINGLDTKLKNKVSKADIVDELSSTATDKVLSAAAGASLNDILSQHKNDTNVHVSDTDRTNWTDAYTHAGKDHAPASIIQGNGISITGSSEAITISNTGILSLDIQSGDNNGCIKYKTNNNTAYSEVGVTGLGTAAYKNEGDFAPSHNHNGLAQQSAVDDITANIAKITSGETSVGKANALTVTNAIGGVDTPIYIDSNGKPATCSQYAGGTAVKLNGSTASASDLSFYAPTSGGSNGQILITDNSGIPVWSNILDDKQDKISFTNKGYVLTSDSSGNLATSSVTTTELNALSGYSSTFSIREVLDNIGDLYTNMSGDYTTLLNKLGGFSIQTMPDSSKLPTDETIITLVPRGL